MRFLAARHSLFEKYELLVLCAAAGSANAQGNSTAFVPAGLRLQRTFASAGISCYSFFISGLYSLVRGLASKLNAGPPAGGAPPAGGGYAAQAPQQGYGAPPQQGYGAPPQQVS